jgi:hypothetical protein
MIAHFGLCGIYSQLTQIAMDLIDDYGLDADPKTSALPDDANAQALLFSNLAMLIPSATAAAEGSLAPGVPLKVTCSRCRVGEGLIKARACNVWPCSRAPA